MDCKHCRRPLMKRDPDAPGWVHADGLQRGKHRCWVEPYGFDAAAEGEPCSFACRGQDGSEPDQVH